MKRQSVFSVILFLIVLDMHFSQVFITKSYDATTHFQTTCADIVDVYRRCTGEDFDFSKINADINTVEQNCWEKELLHVL